MKIGPFIVNVRWIGFDAEWKRLARNGQKIDAIKRLRERLTYRRFESTLLEAKNRVEAYLLKLK